MGPAASGSQKAMLKPIDHLRREGQQPDCTGRVAERPIENLIVIGASAGGHKAIREVLRALPENIPAAVIIMQHLPEKTSSGPFNFTDWLSDSTAMPIVIIQSDQRLRSGAIYVGPPGSSVSLKGRTF